MTLLFDVPQTTLPVANDSSRFPIHRIYCVGRNYAAHSLEMGKDPTKEPPFFFTKPADAIVPSGTTIAYPLNTANLHHEVELVVAIGKAGENIARSEALNYVYGYAVGIDLTRRDLQFEARDLGRPWDWGKAFDHSAPCTEIKKVAEVGHPFNARIWLSVNASMRQDSNVADLIWSVADVIAIISSSMQLQPGDLIFTGTPKGVGPLIPGDHVSGGVDGIGTIDIDIGPRTFA